MKDISIVKTRERIKINSLEEWNKIVSLLKNKGFKLNNCNNPRFSLLYFNEENEIHGSNNGMWSYQASEFLEEEFPEKWCIKLTDENHKSVGEWFNKNTQVKTLIPDYDKHYKFSYLHFPAFEFSKIQVLHSDLKIKDGYKEITLEQFEKKFLNKETNNIMKTTRKKLLSILGKDTCSEFNNYIEHELKTNFKRSDEEEFPLQDTSIHAISRANSNQKELLKSINLIKELDLFSITTYEEVCEALKEEMITSVILNGDKININTKRLKALARLDQIQRLFNSDWKKDWLISTPVYLPSFEKYKEEWKFVGITSNSTHNLGLIIFKNKQTAEYVGKTFINIYKDILE